MSSSEQISDLHQAAVNGRLDDVREWLADGVEVDARERGTHTALLRAVQSCDQNRTAMIRLLLDRGADVNAKGEHGRSPLSEAVWRLAFETSTFKLNPESTSNPEVSAQTRKTRALLPESVSIVRLLLDENADPDNKDTIDNEMGGATPLHHAAWGGLDTVVRWLVEAGADVNACNNRGKTPLQVAKEFHYPKIVAILKAAANGPGSDRPSWWHRIFG